MIKQLMNSTNFTQDSEYYHELQHNPLGGLTKLSQLHGIIHDHGNLVSMLSSLIGQGYDELIAQVLLKIRVRQGDQSVYAKTAADVNRILGSTFEKDFIQHTPELLLDTSFITTIKNLESPADIQRLGDALNSLINIGLINDQDLIRILSDFIIYKQYPTSIVSQVKGNVNLQALMRNLLRHAHYSDEGFIRRVNVLDIARSSESHIEGVQFILQYVKAPSERLMKYLISYLSHSKDQLFMAQAMEMIIEQRSIDDVLLVLRSLYNSTLVKRSLEVIVREIFEVHRAAYFRRLYQLDIEYNSSMFYDYLVNNYYIIRDRITNDHIDDYKLTLLSFIKTRDLFTKLHIKKQVAVINDLHDYANDTEVLKNILPYLGYLPIPELHESIILGLSNVSYSSHLAQNLLKRIISQHWELKRGFIIALLESSSFSFYRTFLKKDIHKLYKNQYTVAELLVDIAEENVHSSNAYIYKKLEKITKPWSESMRKERTNIKKALWKHTSISDRMLLLVWPI